MGRPLYIFSSGQLKREGNTIVVIGQKKHFYPIKNITEIYIFGEISVTKKALEFLTQNKILVHFFNYYGYYVGSYYPREYYNSGYMILKQAEYYLDPKKRLDLARRFVIGATTNMNNTLKYYNKKGKDLSDEIQKIKKLQEKIDQTNTVDELMGIEGNIKKIYYAALNKIISNPEFQITKRTKRPPTTMINALISFGNQLIYTTILSEIYKTHLDPRIGFLHATNFRRFTLNLDVAEIFKPIIPDKITLTLINKKIITPNHFIKSLNGITLNEYGLKLYVKEFDQKMRTTLTHQKLKKKISYRTLIRLELYKIEKHLINDQPYQPFISKW